MPWYRWHPPRFFKPGGPVKRLLLPLSLVFAFGGMCSGGGSDDDDGDNVVVVPVPDDNSDEEHWCCEYEDEGGSKKFALADGPAECNSKYEDMNGRWVSGAQCTPCCCKSSNEGDDEEGEDGDGDDEGSFSYELTTPAACAPVGECLAGDSKECGGKATPRPRPRPNPGGGTATGGRGRPGGSVRPGGGDRSKRRGQ